MPDAAGVGICCGFDSLPAPTVIWCVVALVPRLRTSASITQSALAAISAFVASNRYGCEAHTREPTDVDTMPKAQAPTARRIGERYFIGDVTDVRLSNG